MSIHQNFHIRQLSKDKSSSWVERLFNTTLWSRLYRNCHTKTQEMRRWLMFSLAWSQWRQEAGWARPPWASRSAIEHFFWAWIPSIQVVVSELYSTNTPHTSTPLELQPIHISRPSGDHWSCTDLVDDEHIVVPLWRHANIQDLQETNPGKILRCDTRVVPAGNQTWVGGTPTEWLHHWATGSSAGSKWIRILCSLHKLFILST